MVALPDNQRELAAALRKVERYLIQNLPEGWQVKVIFTPNGMLDIGLTSDYGVTEREFTPSEECDIPYLAKWAQATESGEFGLL